MQSGSSAAARYIGGYEDDQQKRKLALQAEQLRNNLDVTGLQGQNSLNVAKQQGSDQLNNTKQTGVNQLAVGKQTGEFSNQNQLIANQGTLNVAKAGNGLAATIVGSGATTNPDPFASLYPTPTTPAPMQDHSLYRTPRERLMGYADSGLIEGKVDPTVADDVTINAKKGEYVLPVEAVEDLGGASSLDKLVSLIKRRRGLPDHSGAKAPNEPDSQGRMNAPGLADGGSVVRREMYDGNGPLSRGIRNAVATVKSWGRGAQPELAGQDSAVFDVAAPVAAVKAWDARQRGEEPPAAVAALPSHGANTWVQPAEVARPDTNMTSKEMVAIARKGAGQEGKTTAQLSTSNYTPRVESVEGLTPQQLYNKSTELHNAKVIAAIEASGMDNEVKKSTIAHNLATANSLQAKLAADGKDDRVKDIVDLAALEPGKIGMATAQRANIKAGGNLYRVGVPNAKGGEDVISGVLTEEQAKGAAALREELRTAADEYDKGNFVGNYLNDRKAKVTAKSKAYRDRLKDMGLDAPALATK